MKVENPSKQPIAVCRVPDCTSAAPVEAVGDQWKLPRGWEHVVGKGPLCTKHKKNGTGSYVIKTNVTGDTCGDCGSMNLVPAGKCMRCMSCGSQTGCG